MSRKKKRLRGHKVGRAKKQRQSDESFDSFLVAMLMAGRILESILRNNWAGQIRMGHHETKHSITETWTFSAVNRKWEANAITLTLDELADPELQAKEVADENFPFVEGGPPVRVFEGNDPLAVFNAVEGVTTPPDDEAQAGREE